ncbi:L-threonylcarbamoyladenylate synthase, partial [Anaerovibrio sp. RM50]|uniref:L-threonylcarbamoyladenylate synthase n=1 Tax=Anaerovibrio sp. RM50 TaxID=1200557 RepID=UPI00055A4D6C
METKIISVNDVKKDMGAIKEAAKMLREGQLVAIPTETVYGLAANGLDEVAVRSLYDAKERPYYKAFSLQVADVAMVQDIAARVPDMALRLFERFCPGPITIVLPRKKSIPKGVTGGKATVGIRIPDNEIALAVLREAGVPLAVPSANISAHPSPTSAQMVYDDMKGRIPLILDGGTCNLGIESTIVDCTGEEPMIIRHGAISEREVMDCVKG